MFLFNLLHTEGLFVKDCKTDTFSIQRQVGQIYPLSLLLTSLHPTLLSFNSITYKSSKHLIPTGSLSSSPVTPSNRHTFTSSSWSPSKNFLPSHTDLRNFNSHNHFKKLLVSVELVITFKLVLTFKHRRSGHHHGIA